MGDGEETVEKGPGNRVGRVPGRGRQKGKVNLQAETEKLGTCSCVVLFKVLE